VIAAEPGEQGDRGIDHALGFGDNDGAAAEARQPVPLAGIVAFERMRLVLANIEPTDGDELGVGLPAIGAIEPRIEAFQSAQQALAGGAITIPALPINQSA
jgi:hypothetical protein